MCVTEQNLEFKFFLMEDSINANRESEANLTNFDVSLKIKLAGLGLTS